MKIFMLKSMMIASLMFISVLAGIQLANNGIHKIKGYSNPDFKSAISLNDQNNKLKPSLLESEISSHDLKAKKDKLEKMNSFNLFSSVGKTLSDGLSKTSEKILNRIAK